MREGLAHRIAYEAFVGPIPEGADVDHECHNIAHSRGECDGGKDCQHRRCCNPWHLVVRERAANLNRGAHDYSTKEFCKNGHPNALYRHRAPSGQTYCKKCRQEYRATRTQRDMLLQRERRSQ